MDANGPTKITRTRLLCACVDVRVITRLSVTRCQTQYQYTLQIALHPLLLGRPRKGFTSILCYLTVNGLGAEQSTFTCSMRSGAQREYQGLRMMFGTFHGVCGSLCVCVCAVMRACVRCNGLRVRYLLYGSIFRGKFTLLYTCHSQICEYSIW